MRKTFFLKDAFYFHLGTNFPFVQSSKIVLYICIDLKHASHVRQWQKSRHTFIDKKSMNGPMRKAFPSIA